MDFFQRLLDCVEETHLILTISNLDLPMIPDIANVTTAEAAKA